MGKPAKEIGNKCFGVDTEAETGPWFWFPKPGFLVWIDADRSMITFGRQNLDRSFHFDKKDIIDFTK